MQGLGKAYYVWQSPSKGEKAHTLYVHTKDGREMPLNEWERKCRETIINADLDYLIPLVEEYVQHNCLWVKNSELKRYAMDCILKGSYKHWDDFIYQEKLSV